MTTNPDLVHPQSPAQFGELLRKHSKRTGRAYLYPGDNYKSLARYVEGNASSISLQSMSSTEPKEEPYAVLYDLSKEDEGRECHYSGSGGVEELRQLNLDGPAYLLFLRGVSSPDWLSMLATTFSVDPEFLQRQFASTNIDDDHGDLFVSPDLPSSGTNALHLPVVTLLSRKDKDKESGGRDLSDLREASELEMAKYREWMSAQTTVGSSLVRNYYQLSSRHAVMEQNISVSLSRLSAGWVNIVWMDHGQDIGKSARGPWLPEGNRSPFYECLPIIHRQEFLPYREVPAVRLTTSRSYQGWSAAQNANLLPLGYGAWLQHDLMRDDPWYALRDIFSLSLQSINQYLNILADHVDAESRAYHSTGHALVNLRFLKDLITKSQVQRTTLLHAIRSAEGGAWLAVTSAGRDKVSIEHHDRLVSDLNYLVERANALAQSCEKAISELVNHTVYQISESGLRNAVRLERLTLLATLFIPLTFTCTVFGMNFRELGTGRLSIWVFVVALVVVLAFSSLVYFVGVSATKPRTRYQPFIR